ncbi:hypothetical protein [Pseudomonas sp. TMW 2.1634]|uniref:hypothetical protein n=1 Tax=Pseudomonas sp. TMW 2.1634 TaxID=1886807 RepID=UPI000E7343DA|nr:hypothetical protein [Pseudomonas sp. TMW 2.1634]AOA04604.1 hypothetical protein BFC21_01920 [Pseudomonas sp. TMW 2.1634]
MELVYTNQLDGFEPGKRYRVPGLFRNVERDATAVTVIGDYPDIVKAYEEAGVEVEVVDMVRPVSVLAVGGDQSQVDELVGRLQAESDALRVLIEAAEGLSPLEHPEAGELPIRLFDALKAIHTSVGELVSERDSLRSTVDALHGDIKALKKAAITPADEADEIARLKAALDGANVQYRANASKESLERLVAELSKE